MKTTVSFKLSREKLLCRVRQEEVAATPEEIVRQNVLRHMIDNLGYPPSCFVLERSLRQMPHLQHTQRDFPERRFDIVCFASGIHPKYELFPLILIECKATKLTRQVVEQVVGYNHYLHAHTLCIVNQEEAKTGWYDATVKQYVFQPGIPSFTELHAAFAK